MSDASVPQGNVAGGLDALWARLGFKRRGPKPPTYLFYRHTIPVRVLHWINAIAMLVMLMTGLQIFNAHPALYWGKSADFDHPILSMTADGTNEHYWGVTTIGPWKFNTDGVFRVSAT